MYCALLMMVGPLGRAGQLYTLYGSFLEGAFADMKAQERENALDKARGGEG